MDDLKHLKYNKYVVKKMKKGYLQHNQTSRHPLKWAIYSILCVMLICLIVVIVLYIQIEKNKKAGFSETKTQVLAETDLTDIDKVERFHGEDAYHIVYGQTSEGDKQVVFVPFTDDEKEMLTVDQADMINKEAIEAQWSEQCDQCHLIKTIPGILDDDFVWELTYIDESDRYIFEYFSLSNGEPYEMFSLKRLFK